METPSSTTRVIRSQASLASPKKKEEVVMEKQPLSRSRNQGTRKGSVLLDITNDSPIVGLAKGSSVERTPSSYVAKIRGQVKQKTPGSGEALLREQVKTLLQKVEEEATLVNKLSSGNSVPFRSVSRLLNSPASLLAPTPANTPQIANLSGIMEEDIVVGVMMPSVDEEDDDSKIPSQIAEVLNQEKILNSLESTITRAILFESPEKSDASDSSKLSPAWLFQVHKSTQEEEEEISYEGKEEEVEGEGEEEVVDDLCEGMKKISVHEKRGLPEFVGKHTRFLYNSDDEIEGEEEVLKDSTMGCPVSPSVMILKGLPVPEGKHFRFQEEED